MEDNRFTKRKKYLTIGNFEVECYKSSSRIRGEIPFAGMAFYHPGERMADFSFEIGEVEPDNSGKALFGSDSFAIPTFLYQRDTGWYDWRTRQNRGTQGLSFRIDPAWTRFVLYEDETETRGERAFWEFGHLFSYAVLNYDACVLHGVVMEYQGIGILVLAAAGTGKTTHTRMWRDHENALILNGDRCLCRKIREKWYAYGMPWAGSSGEYINRSVPVSVVVALERGAENVVTPVSSYDASICLMQRLFIPNWTGEMQTKAIDLAIDMAGSIPVLRFQCLPTLDSVQVLKTAILKVVR